jgi:hypothetical protein
MSLPSLLKNLCLLLLLAAPVTPAFAKERPPQDPEMAQVWIPGAIDIKRVDGKKPKFHLDVVAIAPGEHVVRIETNHRDYLGATTWTTYVVRATFVRGHTYVWQLHPTAHVPTFHDLGENFVVPKLKMVSTPKEYTEALRKASSFPAHAVAFIPRTEWPED